MAIELIKEAFKVEETIGSKEVQALVETEIYLSPKDIGKILWVQGKVELVNSKLVKDKLIVSGTTRFNILYNSLDDQNETHIHVQEAIKEFREEIEIFGVDENMAAKVKSKIEYIEYDLEESKLHLIALVNLWGQVDEFKTVEAIKEINPIDGLEVLKETINYKEVFARGVSHANINDVINLGDDYPEIDELIKFNTRTKEIESMVADDRIITSGEVLVNLIYYGAERINSYKTTIPFNHFIEMPGATNELDQSVEYEIVEGNYEIMGNEMGERKIVNLEFRVKVTGKAFQDKTRKLIIDAYSTIEELSIEREEISVKENLKNISQIEDINISIKDIDPIDVLELGGYTNILSKNIVGNGIEIDGVLSLNVEYIDRISQEIMSYNMDYPFSSTIYEDVEENAQVDVDSTIGDVNYSINRDSFDIDMKIRLTADLSIYRRIYTIKEIEGTDLLIDKSKAPSIIIYIVQKGDSIWDIAKRYKSTKEDIMQSNNLDSPNLKPGDKIIIEKKIEEIAL